MHGSTGVPAKCGLAACARIPLISASGTSSSQRQGPGWLSISRLQRLSRSRGACPGSAHAGSRVDRLRAARVSNGRNREGVGHGESRTDRGETRARGEGCRLVGCEGMIDAQEDERANETNASAARAVLLVLASDQQPAASNHQPEVVDARARGPGTAGCPVPYPSFRVKSG